MRPQSALAEIHQQKGEIVEHIDRGEPVVEFDRVEQDGRAVDLDDVAQMQIAVAVAQIASPRPRLEQGRERGEPVAACARKVDCRLARQHICIGGEFRLVVAEHVGERPHRLLRRQHAVGGSVERFDHRSQARHRGQSEPPFACHEVIQHRLVEAVHAKHPFDWLPLAAKPEGAAFV